MDIKHWNNILDSLIGLTKEDLEDLMKARLLHEINETQKSGPIHYMTLMLMVKLFPTDFVLQEIMSEALYRIEQYIEADKDFYNYLFAAQPDPDRLDYYYYATKFDIHKKDYINKLIKKFPDKKNIIVDWVYH